MYPRGRRLAREPVVIARHDLVLENAEQIVHVGWLGLHIGRRQGNCPPILSGKAFGPPAVERTELRYAVERRLHAAGPARFERSEEHTSELQSRLHLVCRLLLEKKKKHSQHSIICRTVPT